MTALSPGLGAFLRVLRQSLLTLSIIGCRELLTVLLVVSAVVADEGAVHINCAQGKPGHMIGRIHQMESQMKRRMVGVPLNCVQNLYGEPDHVI